MEMKIIDEIIVEEVSIEDIGFENKTNQQDNQEFLNTVNTLEHIEERFNKLKKENGKR